MKKYQAIILLMAVLVVGGTLSGCASKKTYGPTDTNISVNAGATFTLRLDENPTTGYRWTYTISDETILKPTQDEYVPNKTSGTTVGSGGKRMLTFTAKSKGKAVINMVYERSFDKDPKDTKITYNITVK